MILVDISMMHAILNDGRAVTYAAEEAHIHREARITELQELR